MIFVDPTDFGPGTPLHAEMINFVNEVSTAVKVVPLSYWIAKIDGDYAVPSLASDTIGFVLAFEVQSYIQQR